MKGDFKEINAEKIMGHRIDMSNVRFGDDAHR